MDQAASGEGLDELLEEAKAEFEAYAETPAEVAARGREAGAGELADLIGSTLSRCSTARLEALLEIADPVARLREARVMLALEQGEIAGRPARPVRTPEERAARRRAAAEAVLKMGVEDLRGVLVWQVAERGVEDPEAALRGLSGEELVRLFVG